MKYITGKYALLAIGCWLLAACSSDSTGEVQTDGTLQVVPYTAAYQMMDAPTRTVASGYNVYNPDHDIAIGLYVLPEDPATVKLIRFSSGSWHSQAKVVGDETYDIYGYMPKLESITSSISELTGGDIQLQLSGVPAVIADTVCFITGVKDRTGDLLLGNFKYVGKSDNNYVRLLMDHLFASVRLKFTVDAEYSALRTIKLKELTLQGAKASATATIVLKPNTTGADPVQSVTYTTTGTSSSDIFFESATGETLTSTAVSSYYCSFAPPVGDALTLVSRYDVYDRKGNKVREDCTATNKLPNLNAVRGQCVTLNMTVTPTYLYQLSDPDLDNPTVTIN